MSDGVQPPASARFLARNRVKLRADFLRLQAGARRVHLPHFVVLLGVRDDEQLRLGITVTKKIGNSVARNRVRRLVREVFRLHPELFPLGHDVIFIARSGAPALDFAATHDEVRTAAGAMRAVAERNRKAKRAGQPC